MARIPMLNKPEKLSAEQRKVYDAISATRGGVNGPFSILLHNPDMAERMAHLGDYIRFESRLSSSIRIVAALVTARIMNSEFEFSINAEYGKKAGLSDSVIAAIRERTAPKGLNKEESLVFHVGTELLTAEYRISPPTFDAALKFYGRPGLIDLIATFGYYAHIACILNAFEVEPQPGTPPLKM